MALTEEQIRDCTSDEELFQALSAELHRRLPDGEGDDLDLFVERLRALPKGLRAMAAIYQLDVSMALDDLGWHFANWHHRPYCDETLRGLQELEAHEPAEIFSEAYELAQSYWTRSASCWRRISRSSLTGIPTRSWRRHSIRSIGECGIYARRLTG